MKNQEEMRTLVLDGYFLDQQTARDIPGPDFYMKKTSAVAEVFFCLYQLCDFKKCRPCWAYIFLLFINNQSCTDRNVIINESGIFQ